MPSNRWCKGNLTQEEGGNFKSGIAQASAASAFWYQNRESSQPPSGDLQRVFQKKAGRQTMVVPMGLWETSRSFYHNLRLSHTTTTSEAGLGSLYHRSARWQPELWQAEIQRRHREQPRAPAPSDCPRQPLFPSQEQPFSCFLLEINTF